MKNSKKIISIIPFYGGKSSFIKEIFEIVKLIPHNVFVDVFGGSGKVVFSYKNFIDRKDVRLIWNDKDELLYNLFWYIKEKPEELIKGIRKAKIEMEEYPYNPKRLIEQKRKNIEKLDPLEKAVWTFIIYNFTYLSFWNDVIYLFVRDGSLRAFIRYKQKIREYHKILKDIELYNLDYKDLLKQIPNREDVLLFLDPPYLGFEHKYRVSKENIALEVLDYIESIEWKGSVVYTHNFKPPKEENKNLELLYEELKRKLNDYGYTVKVVKRLSQTKSDKKDVVEEILAYRLPKGKVKLNKTVLDYFKK